MKQSFWKWAGIFLTGMVVGCYTAFVAKNYWNWFAVPALHASEVSFLEMLGLIWLLQLVTSRSTTMEDSKWKILVSAVELCVPPEKQEELAALTENSTLDTFLQGFSQVFGQLFFEYVYVGSRICIASFHLGKKRPHGWVWLYRDALNAAAKAK